MATSSLGSFGSTATASAVPGPISATLSVGTRWPNVAVIGALPGSSTSTVKIQHGSSATAGSQFGFSSPAVLPSGIAVLMTAIPRSPVARSAAALPGMTGMDPPRTAWTTLASPSRAATAAAVTP